MNIELVFRALVANKPFDLHGLASVSPIPTLDLSNYPEVELLNATVIMSLFILGTRPTELSYLTCSAATHNAPFPPHPRDPCYSLL